MNAGAGEPEDDITGGDARSGEHIVTLHRADAEARKVIIAERVHARHLRRLTPDESATGLPAALGNRRNHGGRNLTVQFSRRIIIEEKQRLSALNDEIVGTHCDEIDADAVMTPRLDRELQLGADPVVRGNEQWIPIAGTL